MNLVPLSFLNDNHSFEPCSDCSPETRYRCKTCFGTGRLCPDCYNTGIMNVNAAHNESCNCGIKNQKAYYWEFRSLGLQNLVHVPSEYNGDITDIEEHLHIIADANYLHIAKTEFTYSRFLFTYTREEQFILARYAFLSKMRLAPKGILRGLIYVDALQLNDPLYVDAINDILQNNPSAVAVYFGLSHSLPQNTFPYLSHITKNLFRPAFYFATPEWFESYKFLHALWIDKKWKKEA